MHWAISVYFYVLTLLQYLATHLSSPPPSPHNLIRKCTCVYASVHDHTRPTHMYIYYFSLGMGGINMGTKHNIETKRCLLDHIRDHILR